MTTLNLPYIDDANASQDLVPDASASCVVLNDNGIDPECENSTPGAAEAEHMIHNYQCFPNMQFDLIRSTEPLRRFISRSTRLPSMANISLLDPLVRRRSITALPPGALKLKLAPRDHLAVAVLGVANFFCSVVFSSYSPFLTVEARRRGAGETAIGLLFGLPEMVMLVLPKFGSVYIFCFGLCASGIPSIAFGFLQYTSGITFVALCFTIRITGAVGEAMFTTASMAIVTSSYQLHIAYMIGILKTCTGLGFTLGPFSGGALYEVGKRFCVPFGLPFWVLGGLLILTGLACLCLLPKQHDDAQCGGKSMGNCINLLKSLRMWLMIFVIFVANASYAFLDPTLHDHLEGRFNNSAIVNPTLRSWMETVNSGISADECHLTRSQPGQIYKYQEYTVFFTGTIFLLAGVVYTISAPLWGYLNDRKQCANLIMAIGCISVMMSFSIMGPSPNFQRLFKVDSKLWHVILSMYLLGMGYAAQMVPPFQKCLLIARQQGYPDNLGTYGVVALVFQTAVSAGAFCGATAAPALVKYSSFGQATSLFAFLSFFSAVCTLLQMWLSRHIKAERKRSRRY